MLHLKYYTAGHDVDEDSATIPHQGTEWRGGDIAGIADRFLADSLNTTADSVASSNIQNIPQLYGSP